MRKLWLASASKETTRKHSNMQLHLEIPYGKSILLPVEGSEAFIQYLSKGVLVSKAWRKDDTFTVETWKPELKFVEPVFLMPEPPVVERT